MKRLKKILLTVLIAAMTLGLSLGLAACGGEEKTVTYSVTVTCEDTSVLAGVKVQLKKDSASSEAKQLENGKADFELEAGTYTVVLTGVPEDYTYESKTVTEAAPSASVALTKKDDRPADGLASYTVTVTCEDADVLSKVKVKLMLGTTEVGEQALTDGKASFKLQPGDYTVTLTGVPAGYTYEPKTFTAPNSTVTIALTKESVSSAADITVKVAAGNDVFGKAQPETALKNAKLDLYVSEADLKPTASATTDGSGVAHFDALAAGKYLVSVNGVGSGSLTVNGAAATLTLNVPLGSEAAPIAWTLGENDLPFTEEVLTSLGEKSVFCSLSVEKDGLYSFDADNYNGNVISDLFEDGLIGSETHIAVTLTAGTVYTFECTSTGALAESGQFGYKITVTEGDTQEGGSDAPNIPWTGSGTQADPYIITTLKNTYRVQIKYENGAYVPVYFKYTETAAANYAIYSSDQNFYLTVGNIHYVGGGDASSEASLFQTAAGTDYVFVLTPYDDEETSNVTVSFTIGDFTGYLPKWEGSGVFRTAAGAEKDDPYIVTTLVDSYEVHGADRVYFKYAATETKNYTVTLEGTDGFDFLLRNYNNGKPDSGTHYALNASKKTAVISLTAGTTYLFGVLGGGDGLDGNMAFVVKFTITEGGTPETETPEEPGDGTANKPYKIENILGENTLNVTAEGLYYTFTAPKTGTYTFTAQTTLYLSKFQGSNGKTLNAFTGSKVGATKDYELIAGIAYTFNLSGFGGASVSEVTLKVELKAEAPAVTLPEEFNGNWKGVNNDYSLSITGGNLTVIKNGAPIESVITSQASQTMAGKTSYYVTFDGKTYTLQWNSAGEKMLQLYLNSNTALYFVPDTLPAFTFDADLCGEYADREGKLPDHIVVSANGISWANHTIVLVSDMTAEYPGFDKAFAAYVDGNPELVMFGNDSIYFQKAGLYFDSVKEGGVTLPAEYLGNWKSADGKYTLEATATSVTLKESGSVVSATLKEEKKGSFSYYYLTFDGTEYELTAFLPGTLSLMGETSIHFAKDPLPKVDLSSLTGVYYSADFLGYFVIQADGTIKWGSHTVVAVAAPSTSQYGESGYPLFVDGALYTLIAGPSGSYSLTDTSDGTEYELTYVGTEIPEADGSQTKPYILDTFLGDHTMPGMTTTQTYYVFELPFPATLTFTAKAAGFAVYINGSAWAATSATSKKTVNNLSGVVTLGIQSLNGTADASFTISLNYTVTVKGADKDVYGNTHNEKGKSGVTVTLMKGTEAAQTATTNTSGVATFLVTDLGEYTAKVDDKSYSFTNAACDVTLFSETVLGSSSEHPLSLALGANEFNLSEEVMEQAASGIYYVFECTYSATYTFTLSEAEAMFMLMDDAGGGLNLGALGGLTGKIALEKGKTYTAMLAGGSPVTLTIGLDLGNVEGAGTREDPEVLKTLDPVFRYVGIDANSARYFRFVLDKNYAITIKASKNCTVGGSLVGSGQNLNATSSLTAIVKKNTPVDFFVFLQKNVGEGYVELTFEGTETPDIPFGGSGTQADPYKPDNFAGDYELYVTKNKYVYFEYTVTKDTTYKVTFIEGVALTFYLPTGTLFQTANKNSLSSSKTPDTFTVTAGTKLTFRLYADATGLVKFKIEEVTGA